ncbi:MAG TPA: efflux RND transporter periplasmic adaptor subunit [Vicinamibacterales bacterium]
MNARVPWGHNRTRMLWLGGAGLAAIAAGFAFSANSVSGPEVPVAAVVRKDLSTWISSNGRVEPIDPQLVVARLDTFVRSVSVTEGATVESGQPVMTLDDTDLRAQLARAREEYVAAQEQVRASNSDSGARELDRIEADLQRTDAELTKLRADRSSLQRLVDRQAATRDELAQATVALDRAESEREFLTRRRTDLRQRAESEVQRADFKTEQARQTIATLEEQLRSTRIVAAAAATVYRLTVKTGEHVHVGDTLAELADLRHVRVRAFVDEPELGSVVSGQEVLIAWDALPGRSWAGRTTQIPAAVVPRGGRSVGEVLCSVDNRDMKLLPNINVDVRLRTSNRPRSLTVPRSAVRASEGSRYVFVVRDARLHQQAVNLGISSASDYEVLDGLSEGDRVAIGTGAEARDGMAIRDSGR